MKQRLVKLAVIAALGYLQGFIIGLIFSRISGDRAYRGNMALTFMLLNTAIALLSDSDESYVTYNY